FFQAEDGIRDSSVTGVQTCALPIYLPRLLPLRPAGRRGRPGRLFDLWLRGAGVPRPADATGPGAGAAQGADGGIPLAQGAGRGEIGRASCRERVEIWGVV